MTAVISHSAGFSVMLWPRPHPLFPLVEPLCPLPFAALPFFSPRFPCPTIFLLFIPLRTPPLTFSTSSPYPPLEACSSASSVKFCIRGGRQKTQGRRIGRLLLLPSNPGNFTRSSAPSANQRARPHLISICLSKRARAFAGHT